MIYRLAPGDDVQRHRQATIGNRSLVDNLDSGGFARWKIYGFRVVGGSVYRLGRWR